MRERIPQPPRSGKQEGRRSPQPWRGAQRSRGRELETPVISKEGKEVGLTPHGSTVPAEKSCRSPRKGKLPVPNTANSSRAQQPATTMDGGSCVKLSPQRGQCWRQPEGAGTATAPASPGEHPPQQPSLHTKQPHGLFKPGTCLYNTLENTSPVPTCTSLGKNSVQETKHMPGTCTRVQLSASRFGRRTRLLGA